MEVERARRLDYDLLKTYVRLPDLLQKRAIEGAHRIGIPTSSHEIYPAALSGTDSVEHTGATSRRGYSPKQIGHGPIVRGRDPDHREVADDDHADRRARRLSGGRVGRSVDLRDPRMTALQPSWVAAGGGGRRPWRARPRRGSGARSAGAQHLHPALGKER